MPLIQLETKIRSKIEICFDLSRSIDLHTISTEHTKEKAVDGITSGLIGMNQFVTWQAVHFLVRQKLTSRITAFERPFHFKDEQVAGIFKSISHDHFFEEIDGYVLMRDVFFFESPCGILGKMVNRIYLINYLRNLLMHRNQIIKEYAESDKWRIILSRCYHE
jgi:ligand-binding SRPBCC domain-containing protein